LSYISQIGDRLPLKIHRLGTAGARDINLVPKIPPHWVEQYRQLYKHIYDILMKLWWLKLPSLSLFESIFWPIFGHKIPSQGHRDLIFVPKKQISMSRIWINYFVVNQTTPQYHKTPKTVFLGSFWPQWDPG
jgi:hypothetical protein